MTTPKKTNREPPDVRRQRDEVELRRLAIRAKLGIDEDVRRTVRKKQQANDIKASETRDQKVEQAKAEGKPIIEVGPEPTQEPEVITRRIDGRLKNQPLSDDFKRALRRAFLDDLSVDVKSLSAVTGVSEGALWACLAEHPKTLSLARQRREAATLANLEIALHRMSEDLRAAVETGDVKPSGKNIRDWAVAYGILTDKRALAVGQPTSRHEITAETQDERKARLSKILDKAEATLILIQGGESKSRRKPA